MKSKKGITLIALIITIVVLLILAVVAIKSVSGDRIITYAKNSANEYTTQANDEKRKINTLAILIQESLTDKPKEITWSRTSAGDLELKSTVATSTGENFYVIGFKGTNNETVILLAKECIDTKALVQSATPNLVRFCEQSVEGYWGSKNSPYDIYEKVQPIPSTHTAAYAADRYGAKLGVKGRLMSYSEMSQLRTSTNGFGDIIYGRNGTSSNAKGYLEYWLGYASSWDTVWYANGNNQNTSRILSKFTSCVRPVIEISRSIIL